ncbi:MAG: hypothetical protein VX641_07450 [Planctomycetota bacterium]|nr:hypothetical protein [Planctomycetota bacterium]
MRTFPSSVLRLLDPGWPWLLAGVLLMVSAAVIPSEQRLLREEAAVRQLEEERNHLRQVSETYVRFLDEVGRGEESLVRRLAAAQLGIVPEGAEPLVMLSGVTDPPTRWIERAAMVQLGQDQSTADATADSMLVSILEGTGQLWIFGAALFLIFVGLLLGPATDEPDPANSSASATA